MEVWSGIPVLSLIYGNYGELVNNGWIYSLWEVIWREGVQLCMRTLLVLPTQREEDIFLMEILTNIEIITQNGLWCINLLLVLSRVYSLACNTTGDRIGLKTEYLKNMTHPQKISSEWSVIRLSCQDKTLWKESMRTITSKIVLLSDLWVSRKELDTINR